MGSDSGTWGGLLNTDLDGIDSTVFAVSGVASAALPKAGGTLTGAILNAVGAVGTPSISFAGDTNTGFYWISGDHFAAVTNGAAVVTYGPGGITANGALTVTGTATFNGEVLSTGLIQTAASGGAGAGLNIPQGVAPTTPNNGDVWATSAGAFIRIAGSTLQFASPSAGSVTSFNTRTGVVTLTGADVTTALGYTPQNPTGLGTAATQNTGSSGATIPLNNANNTTSGNNTHSGTETFGGKVTLNAGADISAPLAAPTVTEAGYMGAPQNVQAGAYTLVIADRGREIFKSGSGIVTIPPNGSVAFPIGTTIEISADTGVTATIAIATDVLRWVPSNVTGPRTLAGPGTCVIQKKKAAEWWIKGDVT